MLKGFFVGLGHGSGIQGRDSIKHVQCSIAKQLNTKTKAFGWLKKSLDFFLPIRLLYLRVERLRYAVNVCTELGPELINGPGLFDTVANYCV